MLVIIECKTSQNINSARKKELKIPGKFQNAELT